MKLTLSISLCVAMTILSCQTPTQNETKTNQSPVYAIQQKRMPFKLVKPLSEYQNHDVAVFHLYTDISQGHGFGFNFLHNFSGALRDYHAVVYDSNPYDLYQYHWKNDTTVNVTLTNSKTKKQYKVVLFGNKNNTGLRID